MNLMSQMSGLDFKIQEMAHRIRELREIEGYTVAEMAMKTGVDEQEYLACEEGRSDLNFAFIYRCALAFQVDVSDIIQGSSPKLASFTVTRRGQGQDIGSAHGMQYFNLAAAFRNRIAEPLYVKVPYNPTSAHEDIELTTHQGQELDIVIEGQLKVQVGEHTTVLNAGDTIYYDSGTPHGMIATGSQDCLFYAIVLNPTGEPLPELTAQPSLPVDAPSQDAAAAEDMIWHRYIDVTKDENGTPTSIRFKNTDRFNFAFDIVDGIAEKEPNRLAMLHLDKEKNEHRFTFRDMKKISNQCANYFKSLGIKKGDRVMLVLKRHYQFWFAMLGLHKLGAIVIPATSQLQAHDFEYRFKAAGVRAILCTADGETARQADIAAGTAPCLEFKLIVNGHREGWRSFDDEYTMFSSHFDRTEDSPGGDTELMLMFFTSGTTGYPKIAAHTYTYPLGHFHTARFWHCVNPNGLHLTISETGWAKSLWGKLYGQWLCEAAIFVYDFDRFDAADILPLFAQYHITTFCAPPTMYRMMIREDLTRYDLSSVQHATIAGEALNPEVFRLLESQTGLRVMEGFGQSETSLVIGNLTGDTHKIGSMGKVTPLYKVSLLDASGVEVPRGEAGEICIDLHDGRPFGLFREYYNDPAKTKEAIHDGWYHTGDLAWQDEDGFFWYVGRADDVIKSSGYRIGPFEIESVIMELSYVLECGVSAAPDPVRGQVVKASIVLTRGTEPTEELKKEIQEYVKAHTAPYKYPRIIVFRDSLPKTTSGKIRRNQL